MLRPDITHHFLTFLISNVNISIYYFPLNAAAAAPVFKHPPIVAYRRTSNLRDILVKAKLPTITTPDNTSLPPGSFCCEQDCATCPYITNGLKYYTFFSTGATRQIKTHNLQKFNLHDTV